jgi:tetratricopeptide (TPR) repeat protein
MPKPYSPPPPPEELTTVEELYLAGQRLEQFHNPSLQPEPYWEEALRRDPDDARVNTAFGLRLLKQARFTEAEAHFRRAIARLCANHTTPKDGEPFYYLGVALQAQAADGAQNLGRQSEAYDAFYKATWSEAWRAPAYFSLAQIAALRGDFPAALRFADHSLEANALDLRALTLKAALLRHTGQPKAALALLDLARRYTDPLDVGLLAEQWLLSGQRLPSALADTLRRHPATGLEAATDYANAGLWQDATTILKFTLETALDKGRVSPLVCYYLADFSERFGDSAKAAEYRRQAMSLPPDYVFAFQWEAIPILRRAIAANPSDLRAPYYLGNLLADWQPKEAIALWQQSAWLDPSFAIVHRNLAVLYSHDEPTNDTLIAIGELEKAVAEPAKYALHFTELDELYAATGYPPEKRLALLEHNHETVLKRDDALSREIGLKVWAGKYDEAIQLMTDRKFAVWEGGTLAVADHWVNAHLLRGRKSLASNNFQAAQADFQAASAIPDNLPNDQESAGRNAEIAYWLGLAFEAGGVGDLTKARQFWQDAATATPESPRHRPDGAISEQLIQTYYQALAQRKLGQNDEADTLFRRLVAAGDRALGQTEPGGDGGAPRRRSSPAARAALAHYAAGLGHLGLGEKEKARQEFTLALKAAPDTLGAKAELEWLKKMEH